MRFVLQVGRTGYFIKFRDSPLSESGKRNLPDCLFFQEASSQCELHVHCMERRHCHGRQRGATKRQETSIPESRHDFGINGMAGFVTNEADAIRKNRSPSASAAFN